MALPESLERSKQAPLELRIDEWYRRIDNIPSDRWQIEKVFTEGYQLFFEILKPFKETGWIKSEHPDISHNAYLKPQLMGSLREFKDIFGRWSNCWGVQIYDYHMRDYNGDEQASLLLSCGDYCPHGTKLFRVYLIKPSPGGFSEPHGQMYIEDTQVNLLRWGDSGEPEPDPPEGRKGKMLLDYPAVALRKLPVALAYGFAKNLRT